MAFTLTDRGHREGTTTKAIEQRTKYVPSAAFLSAAGVSILASLVFKSMNRNSLALFVGQWVPTFLILGLYNKLVKIEGSDEKAF